MSAERDPIDELLASISDGGRVDWDAAERSVDPDGRGRFRALREVERIAAFNRGLQREANSAPPERWGDLLLLERIGQGTRGEVYRAWDPALRREVALKLLPAGRESAALLEEGRAAARVRHPNAVTVHGVDRRDGRVGLWMELVRGATLEQQVRSQGPLDAAGARRLGIEIGSALQATHAAGLLHRDVKPANIVRDVEGRHVLADFGLGARWDETATGPSGTPMYMAPELLAGSPATERSEVYSLGMVLWFALAGRHPFEVDSIERLVAAARTGPRPALRQTRADVPASLAAVVERAIAPDPASRFASAGAMVEALERWRPEPPSAPRRARVPAVLAIAALIGVAALALWRARTVTPPAPAAVAPPAATPGAVYAVDAWFLRRDHDRATPLVSGDRVKPGDRLSLQFRSTRPAWVYVLNEDDRGERYVLFPQPRFDRGNPLPADSTLVLPGTVGGGENAWTVTSAGGREYFLVVASPGPVAEIEADLGRLPAARPGRPVEYTPVGAAAMERLRGVGGVVVLPRDSTRPAPRSRAFDRFRALAGRETGIQGVWVRQIVLENPR